VTSSATPQRSLLALALVTALSASPSSPAQGQSLPETLTRLLDRPPLDRHLWGIAVLDHDGRLLFGRNEDRLFIPASNTKLIVTAVAAALLPPGWRVRTSVYRTGDLEQGRLAGDLILYGRGDPTMSRRCFAVDSLAPGACERDPARAFRVLAGRLKAAGLREIAGDLIGDGSYFEPIAVHPSWEVEDLIYGYAAPVSGLGFSDNSVTASVAPGPRPGAVAIVTTEPAVPGYEVVVRAVTTADGVPTSLVWSREPDGTRYLLTGTIHASSPPHEATLAVVEPNRFAALAFAAVLADSGIVLHGLVRGTGDSLETAGARSREPFAEVESRPIGDWIFPILNESQNWFAEMLVKALGRELGGGGSWQRGIEVERRFLIDSMRIDSTQISIRDGSGLSEKNLVSPLAFARILHFMRTDSRFATFAPGLPKSGAIGSLETRFLKTPLEGRVRAKTGSLTGVSSLSGYVDPEVGCRTFSIQANHHTIGGQAMIQAIDSLVVAIGADCSK
jgi:D-alanyl-D-alanine carboxypeptidase/D-alanyl-D-alanine-endopeptidase (penicillin-binding protein 4)